MESDEFETINSIENWLAAPLETPPTTIVSAAASANAVITEGPHPSVTTNLPQSQHPPASNSVYESANQSPGLTSGDTQSGSALTQNNEESTAVVFEAASFGPIAHGEGLNVSGNFLSAVFTS
jgi:hypothetical protein